MFAYMIGLLGHRYSLWALLMINGLGTIYGYMWYWKQLQATPLAFIPFVPDSPTASLFFVLVLIGCLLNRHWGLLQAFAAVTLIKYGVWAVVMNVFQVIEGAPFHWQIWMLTLSHAGMALQALLFMPFFRIKGWHLMVVFTWVVLNDVMDYFFDMHPWLSSYIMPYIGKIGLFTFGLSLASVALVYFLRRPERSEKTEALDSGD